MPEDSSELNLQVKIRIRYKKRGPIGQPHKYKLICPCCGRSPFQGGATSLFNAIRTCFLEWTKINLLNDNMFDTPHNELEKERAFFIDIEWVDPRGETKPDTIDDFEEKEELCDYISPGIPVPCCLDMGHTGHHQYKCHSPFCPGYEWISTKSRPHPSSTCGDNSDE